MCKVFGYSKQAYYKQLHTMPKYSSKGRNSCWAYQKETGNMETGQRQKPAPVFTKRI